MKEIIISVMSFIGGAVIYALFAVSIKQAIVTEIAKLKAEILGKL